MITLSFDYSFFQQYLQGMVGGKRSGFYVSSWNRWIGRYHSSSSALGKITGGAFCNNSVVLFRSFLSDAIKASWHGTCRRSTEYCLLPETVHVMIPPFLKNKWHIVEICLGRRLTIVLRLHIVFTTYTAYISWIFPLHLWD